MGEVCICHKLGCDCVSGLAVWAAAVIGVLLVMIVVLLAARE